MENPAMLYLALLSFFFIGYLAIVFEKKIHVNKAATALIMAVGCWWLYFIQSAPETSQAALLSSVADVAEIIFFLLACMIIVELMDSHQGFQLITNIFYSASSRKRLWFLLGISFFMSAILDNLTSMLVMASLLKKMVPSRKERWMLGSLIVIAVNAGGAWTPIGDVTTTMLWINDKISTWETMKTLFLPSIICTVTAGLVATWLIPHERDQKATTLFKLPLEPAARHVFFAGVCSLVMIPVWKAAFGLPPFMGALIGLGLLWLITDILHARHGEDRWHLRVMHVLTKIDTSGVLFFLGILLAIQALAVAGLLADFSDSLQQLIPNQHWVAVILGLVSSVIDNVPLVAATMGMYDMTLYPMDDPLWQLIAYAAGTGGSILIIGSAAGVAFMGVEKIDFLWYFRHVSWIALIGYLAGVIAYFAQLFFI